ncbi:MAG: hypothetical protein AAGI23_05180 [Bacteroidota bacterium]
MKSIIISIFFISGFIQLHAQTLTGRIIHEGRTRVCNVKIDLLDADQIVIGTTMTNEEGDYSIDLPDDGDGYSIFVGKEDEGEFLNGLSTFDIVLMKQHILGIQILDDPQLIQAADLNNSNSLTVTDLLIVRNLILGITVETEVPNWLFSRTNGGPANTDNLFQLNGNTVFNMIAYKRGDIDFSADPCR